MTILRQLLHADYAPQAKSFDAEVIVTSNHAGTHVDPLSHFDRRPDAPKIAGMPLDLFFGDAVCIDLRHHPAGQAVRPEEIEAALAGAGLGLRPRLVLFCTPLQPHRRHRGVPRNYSGVTAESVHWMRARGRADPRRRGGEP